MPPKPPLYYDYVVKSGDTLSGIIHKMYGQAPSSSGYRKSLDHVLTLNPQIKNPNRIFPGSVIHLGVISTATRATSPVTMSKPSGSTSAKKPGKSIPTYLSPQDADYLWALSWLEHNSNTLVVPGSVLAGATSNLLSPGNTALINKVSDLYAEFKSERLTKGQYDSQRKAALVSRTINYET
jgi:LysM repeat protein